MYYLPVISSVPIVLYITYEEWMITEHSQMNVASLVLYISFSHFFQWNHQSQCCMHQDLTAGSIRGIENQVHVCLRACLYMFMWPAIYLSANPFSNSTIYICLKVSIICPFKYLTQSMFIIYYNLFIQLIQPVCPLNCCRFVQWFVTC